MTLPAVIEPMTESQARACITLIQGHIKTARAQIYELWQREGWRALGYVSWHDCVVAEFGKISRSYLYRQLQAAQVELLVMPHGQIGTVGETKLRPLAENGLSDGQKIDVWEQATVNGSIVPSAFRVQELAEKALAGMPPDEAKGIIEGNENRIITRAKKRRKIETTKQLLDWLDKWVARALRKMNNSGLNFKPLPSQLTRVKKRLAEVRVRLLTRQK